MRTELSLSDEWETPNELYDYLCNTYKIYPELDVACTSENCITGRMIPIDSLAADWDTGDKCDVWCNPPHTKTEEFVKKAYEEWIKHNINIMMILPANAMCTNYAENWIEPFARYHPINRRLCKFLHKGKKMDSSRNGYFVVIWRKVNK